MSDLGNIDGTYKEGMVQKKRKNISALGENS